LIDTHAHLYDEKIKANIDQIMEAASEAKVESIMMPNVDIETIDAMHEIEERYPNTYAMMGLHPCSVDIAWKDQLKIMERWLNTRSYIGIGETGIDLYWDKTYYEDQKKSFQRQIDISRDMKLPIIIHSRESLDICIKMIKDNQDGELKGIFHCFSSDITHAQKIKDLNFHIGIGGVITYKNAKLPEVLKINGLDNVVLETDSPYLPPVPHRGQLNQPSFMCYVASKIAEAMEIDVDTVIQTTSRNANIVYNR
jgi:TatD DNase family protein